jgi:hypothetical protein
MLEPREECRKRDDAGHTESLADKDCGDHPSRWEGDAKSRHSHANFMDHASAEES